MMHCPLPRRGFLRRMLIGSSSLALSAPLRADARPGIAAVGSQPSGKGPILVRNGVPQQAVEEAVLFSFDDCSLPFTRDLHMSLAPGRKFPDETDDGRNIVMDPRHPGKPVLAQGKPGEPDSYEVICPIVFFIEGEFRMWYLGQGEDRKRRSCFAVSKDGFHWEKPKLGLVPFNGTKDNNLVQGPCGEWVLYDPEDPDPTRRFKSLYMVAEMRIAASFSSDGLTWRAGPQDLFGIGMEVGHVFKFNGCYYVNGQGGPAPINRPIPPAITEAPKRIVVTYASYDFEHWTHAAAMSFRRDNVPPRIPSDFEPHRGEQVHEGAALWDRGNVLLGLYGQYHNESNDRRYSTCDLGFVVSHDALHLKEPVPDFKMVHSYEERDGAEPRLIQRNAFANIGDRTVYWYSVWREHPGKPTGVRVATWERDRLGYFAAARKNQGFGAAYEPHCISCPIEVARQGGRIFVNAGGLGTHSQIRVQVLDEQFRPLPGYSGEDCIPISESELRRAVTWRNRNHLERFSYPIRIRVDWQGIRPEDARLYAVYVA
ncbi:MAG: hypothetical protein FJW26_02370 [Acidimicrobiia bacterium]|nr:hypothetical protein [Acidimicrobiia bacterium]